MGNIFCDQIRVLEWSQDVQPFLDDTVHVYRVQISGNNEKIEACLQYLSQKEIERSNLYRNKIDRDRFVIGRSMVKRLAAEILNKDINLLEITYLENNKPVICNEISLQFNLSHSGDFVVLAICKNWETGIDLEQCTNIFKFQPILDYCMSKSEQIKILEDKNPINQFLMYWTRKEAILKATGIGILDRLNKFSCLDGNNLVPDVLTGIASQWLIRSFYIDNNHIVSLAHDSNINKLRFFDYKL